MFSTMLVRTRAILCKVPEGIYNLYFHESIPEDKSSSTVITVMFFDK
jgi:hypothetical protein